MICFAHNGDFYLYLGMLFYNKTGSYKLIKLCPLITINQFLNPQDLILI